MFEGGLFPYWVFIFLMMTGLYVVISRDNLIKKIIGLNIFQVSVIMFYIAMGEVRGGTAPIEAEGVTSVAMPRLATGVGGMSWEEVHPLIEKHLGDLAIPVYVYVTYHEGEQASKTA